MAGTRFAVEVMKLDAVGKLMPLKEPVFPSLPSPKITIEKFEIGNIREAADGSSYVCDLRVTGSVASAFCDLMPGSEGQIERGELVINDSDKVHTAFEIKVQKLDAKSATELRRPFPYSGRFDSTIAALPITEGNNTFRLQVADKVYGLHGFVLWAASFALPYEPEPGDEPAPDAPKTPTIVTGPEQVSGGAAGELHLYALAVSGVDASEAEALRIYFGDEKPLACGLIPAAGAESYLVKRPDAEVPLLFSLRPTDRERGFEPDDKLVMASLLKRPGAATLTDRGAFLLGLSAGVFAVGGDIVAGTEEQAIAVVRFSAEKGSLVLAGHLSKEGQQLQDFEAPLPANFAEAPPPIAAAMESSALLWYMAQLARTRDPRAEEIGLALILGDLSDVGLEGGKLEDWREYFYMVMAELLEEMITSNANRPAGEHGYLVGRCLTEALRVTLLPERRDRIEDIGKVGLLKKLKEVRFFGGKSPGGKPMRKQQSLIEGLRRFFGGN